MSLQRSGLTIEKLGKKFDSHFELVNYAIDLAKNLVSTGRNCRVSTTVQNPAFWVLLEIAEGKDIFDEIQEESSSDESVTRESISRKAAEHKK